MAVSLVAGSYFNVPGAINFPAGDWSIGIMVRLPAGLVSGQFKFLLSSNAVNTANCFHFAAWCLDSSNPRSFVTNVYSNNGNGIFDFDFKIGDENGVVPGWHLVIAQREANNINTYFVPVGTESLGPQGSASYGFNEVLLDGMFVGRADPITGSEYNWGNELAEFFILNDGSLTLSQINELASGKNIAEVYANPLINLRFTESAETVPDLSGNGYDAIRTGANAVTVAHPFVLSNIAEQLPAATDSASATFVAQSFSGDIVESLPAAADAGVAQSAAPEYSAVVSELLPGAVDAAVAEFEVQAVSGSITEIVPASTDAAFALSGGVIPQPSAERTVLIPPALRVALVAAAERRVFIQ